jgi:multidrug efflux pump subunit AcrA (membrane-fusion protein)
VRPRDGRTAETRTLEGRDPVDEVARRLPVTDRPTWLILLGILLLIAGGVAWAVFGRAPDAATGPGIVVPEQGFVEVGTALQGTVISVAVAPGDHVDDRARVADIRTQTGRVVSVRSPVDGTVATVLVRKGGVTDRGTAIVTIEPSGSSPVVVGFLPAGPGKRIETGMPARVALASAPRSQFGTIEGTVRAVSPVPVPPERIVLVVGGNVSLADYFMVSGPVLEVTISLDRDPSTPSGYAWTTGEGPPTGVSSGTLVEASVVVSEAAPVQQILR